MERKQIQFTAKIGDVKQVNPEFTVASCTVMALGKNRNQSHIGSDAARDAEYSLWNIPIVGHIYETEDGKRYMGGHDMEFTKDENGNYHFKVLTVPLGVVPERPDNLKYEVIEEPNGRGPHTYMRCDAILWTGRYPEILDAESDTNDGVMFNESMEITPTAYEPLKDDPNYMDITSYTYSALCLLGRYQDTEKSVEPCFPNSCIEKVDYSLDNNFSELFAELKTELSNAFGTNTEKGGDKLENENVTVEPVQEPVQVVNEAPAEEPQAQFDDTSAVAEPAEKPQVEPVADPVIEDEIHFGATYNQKREALNKMLPMNVTRNGDGKIVSETYYYVMDFDDTYVYVEADTYDANGYEEKHYRIGYSYNEEANVAEVNGEFEKITLMWLTDEQVKQINDTNAQFSLLVEYKKNREIEDLHASLDAVVGEFSDLEGNEEFDSIAEARYSYADADALRNACYIVRGKFAAPVQQKKAPTGVVIPVNHTQDRPAMTARERLHEMYGNK